MGIVRDITVEELKQAVNNIDTSSLAQDSTLRDVVTAISSISGGNDPVTNTTVNSLCKDTTGQSIATAITALGSTLGSDKANISGDNIANKLLFRENIGLGVETITLTPTVTSGVTSRGFTAFKSGSLVIVNAYFDLTRSFANNERIVTFNEFLPAMVGSYAVSSIHSVATQEGFISIGVNETNNIKAWGTIPSGSYYYGQLMYFTRS